MTAAIGMPKLLAGPQKSAGCGCQHEQRASVVLSRRTSGTEVVQCWVGSYTRIERLDRCRHAVR